MAWQTRFSMALKINTIKNAGTSHLCGSVFVNHWFIGSVQSVRELHW